MSAAARNMSLRGNVKQFAVRMLHVFFMQLLITL